MNLVKKVNRNLKVILGMKPKFYRVKEASMMRYPIADNLLINRSIIELLANKLKEVYGDDKKVVLIGTGSSGAIVGSYIAMTNGYEYRHVRKQGVSSHGKSDMGIIYKEGMKVVIVDDFMSSGQTLNRIHKEIKHVLENSNKEVDCLCISGVAYAQSLKFKPKKIVAQNLYE